MRAWCSCHSSGDETSARLFKGTFDELFIQLIAILFNISQNEGPEPINPLLEVPTGCTVALSCHMRTIYSYLMLSLCLSICLSACVSIYRSIYRSIHLSSFLFICLCVCRPISRVQTCLSLCVRKRLRESVFVRVVGSSMPGSTVEPFYCTERFC